MLVVIRGAGDIASGIAIRLYHAGFSVVMTDIAMPTSIRRTVCFSEAIYKGVQRVEDVTARLAADITEVPAILDKKEIPVIVDPSADLCAVIEPDVVVDAILAKRNLGTTIDMADVVIGVGPGFTAGKDCHAVVETMRGHTLGRVITEGPAMANTNIPGLIGGFAGERVLRAPCDGIFQTVRQIGDSVQAGDTVAYVNDEPVVATLTGTLRGLLPSGVVVHQGMKSGDVDPRNESSYCKLVSDKALSVAGGVLEAILRFSNAPRFQVF